MKKVVLLVGLCVPWTALCAVLLVAGCERYKPVGKYEDSTVFEDTFTGKLYCPDSDGYGGYKLREIKQ
jgi:hypothetical protein